MEILKELLTLRLKTITICADLVTRRLAAIEQPVGGNLARIYAAAAVPTDVIESARVEGAGECTFFPGSPPR